MASPSSTSENIPVRGRSDSTSQGPSSLRHVSINRLGSPVRGSPGMASPLAAGGAAGSPTSASYLAAAFHGTGAGSPPRFGPPSRFATFTPPSRSAATSPPPPSSHSPSVYGSVDRRSGFENPEIVRRHLVSDTDVNV